MKEIGKTLIEMTYTPFHQLFLLAHCWSQDKFFKNRKNFENQTLLKFPKNRNFEILAPQKRIVKTISLKKHGQLSHLDFVR